MRRRGVFIVAMAVVIGLGCWWALRSEPTATPETSTPTVVETSHDVAARREETARRNAERVARREREKDETKAAAEAAGTLVVRVVVKEKGDPVAGARVVVRGENLNVREATTDARGEAKFDDFHDDYARIETTAAGFTRGNAFAAMRELKNGAPLVVEVEPGLPLDGVVREESDGRGIAGARVVATLEGGAATETVTSADGSFHFDGMPASRNRMNGVAIPIAPIRVTERHHIPAGAAWIASSAPYIEIRMAAAGFLHGRVLDPSGAPASWASVVAQNFVPNSDGSASWQINGNAQTDADGRYELGGLPLGRKWRVVASKPSFVDSLSVDDLVLEPGRADAVRDFALRSPAHVVIHVLRPNGSPGAGTKVRLVGSEGHLIERTADASGACDIEMVTLGACTLGVQDWGFAAATLDVDAESGDRREIDVRLQPGATLAGVVVDDAGAPIGDVALSARSAGNGPTSGWTHDDVTEKDGTFCIKGLAPGDVVVDVSGVAGHETLSRVPETAPATDARIVMRRLGGVSFRLRVPPGATPPRQCITSMASNAHEHTSSFTSQTIPWSLEEIRVAALAGTWRFSLFADNYLSFARTVDVAPGADTSLGEIVLDPGLTLEGRVVDSEGRPVAGAFITRTQRVEMKGLSGAALGAPKLRTRMAYLGIRSEFEDTDSSGVFRLEHVAPGTLNLTVAADGFADAAAAADVVAGAAPLVVTLHRGGVVRGTLRDAAGKPVADADVVVGDPPATSLPLGPSGAFTSRICAGRARLVVRRGETTLATRDVDVREGEETAVEITLER